MKLNNKGWSFKEMLAIMLVLVICLLLATFYVYRLYSQIDKPIIQEENNIKKEQEQKENKPSYQDLEIKLKEQAIYYIENIFNGEISSMFIITLNDLKEEGLIDDNFNDCDGYVKVMIGEDKHEYDPYLKCDNYESKNYSDIYE